MKHSRFSLAACAATLAMLAGCATTGTPDIRVNQAPDANFTSYSTFGFPEQTGTDRGGYSTLVTSYFKAAVRDQMEQRGYHYVDENPDLLVNFYAKVHERTEVRQDPSFSAAYGYYGYRYGLYSAWPFYDDAVRTVTYPVGTANIDVVDAHRKQMIWEGVAQGVVSDEDMDHPQQSISRIVTQVFARYPGRAGIVENSRQ
ncbi:MAG TPA: DUF4136 domain-containing protein [Steroidobacteraceae bacterium]|jgi:uncharacterized protein DUF4136|nr:DUF4136 domain-containing protein [Steroidobacteraceae bacterium]